MMKTLIISDVHNRVNIVEKMIAFEKPNKVIFLGDYFDDFYDTAHDIEETAIWLQTSLKKKNRVHLLGNHDLSYYKNLHLAKCSGYAQWKNIIINDIFENSDWDKLKTFHIENNILFTHAGFHDCYVDEYLKTPEYQCRKIYDEWFDTNLINLTIDAFRGKGWLFGAGRSRGGNLKIGGILWCDHYEYRPFLGFHQIFGHTPVTQPIWTFMNKDGVNKEGFHHLTKKEIGDPFVESISLALDTHNSHYALIQNGKIVVKPFPVIK